VIWIDRSKEGGQDSEVGGPGPP